MSRSKKSQSKPTDHYTPSSQMADKLAANRTGHLTPAQRRPLQIAALVTGGGLMAALVIGAIMSWGFFKSISVTGVFGICMFGFTAWSFTFLVIVLWVNALMFVPEALSPSPVRWQRDKLVIKMATRDRPEMPFSYVIGSYSCAPFVVPEEVPMHKGREYIVYYTSRSRLLLSLAPADQPESTQWLPQPKG